MNNIFKNIYDYFHNLIHEIYISLAQLGVYNTSKMNSLQQAKLYTSILLKNVLQYGYTLEEVETKFKLTEVRNKFACCGINIDELIKECNINYYNDVNKVNIFYQQLCTTNNIKIITSKGIILTGNNKILKIK